VDTDRLNRWLTLATNLAVVFGIAFLVIEVQQNTAAIRGQASIAINDSLASLDRAIYADAELSDIWVRGRESLDNLDPVELERFKAFVLERLNLAVYIEELERSGSADVHIEWIDYIATEVRDYPGMKEFVLSMEDSWSGSDELFQRFTSDLTE
jgi:hypothetical protein